MGVRVFLIPRKKAINANAININGTSQNPIYYGGSVEISIASATVVVQQISIVFTTSSSTPWQVMSSILNVSA